MSSDRTIFRVRGGKLLRGAATRISPIDRGLLYGDGLYETMRCYWGKLFRLDDHLARLARGAEVLDLELGARAIAKFQKMIPEAVRITGHQSCRVRLTVTRGEVKGDWRDASAVGEPTVLIEVNQLPDDPELRSVTLATVSIRRDERSPLSNIKSLNFLPSILARAEARRLGADDALMLNTLGQVAEASSSNIFAVFGDELVTPPVEAGILPGIVRLTVLELAPSLGLRPVERTLLPADLIEADEVFITNSVREVVRVAVLDGHRFAEASEVTQGMHQAYRASATRS